MDILFLSHYTSNACGWYRNAGIIPHLRKVTGWNITIAKYNDVAPIEWSLIMQYDVIYMQNPLGRDSAMLVRKIIECGKKCYIDYDDQYLALNPENERYEEYNTDEVKKSIISILKNASVVSVTTEYLKQCLIEFNKNIWVIPNAHNDFLLKRGELKPRNKTVLWRGGRSHIYDLQYHASALDSAAKEFPDWKFHYMGFYPWFLKKAENNGHIAGTDIILYFKLLFSMNISVMTVPLTDDVFNHCKSPIAAIEASWAGSASITPSWWNFPSALHYGNTQELFDCIYAALTGEVDIEKQAALSWEFVCDTLLLSRVNKKRVELIKSL